MENNLEIAILGALYDHRESNPGAPEMTFSELYNAIGVSPADMKKVAEVRHQLFSLGEKAWVERQSLTDGSGGIAIITRQGARVIEDSRQNVASMAGGKVGTVELCPATLEALIRDQACAPLIQRDDVLHEIKGYFEQSPIRRHFIVLHGQPMVGKSRILKRLSKILGDGYVPLMVTGQGLGLSALGSLDDFALDLADQLTNRFFKWWADCYEVPLELNKPGRKDFQGRGTRAFYAHWDNLRQNAGKRLFVIMIDEIERLLDYQDELNPQIVSFLHEFVRNRENGCFVLAGSERIQHASDRQFSRLIADGYPIRVHYYDEGTVSAVLSVFGQYFTVDEGFLQCLSALCDGHPRFLPAFYEATRSLGKANLERSDIEPVLDEVLDQADDILWALVQRLSRDEYAVVWLTSQNVSTLLDEPLCSLTELLEIQAEPMADYGSLKKGVTYLAKRQWTQWENKRHGLFRFKLGIVPLWVRRNHISPDEVSFR